MLRPFVVLIALAAAVLPAAAQSAPPAAATPVGLPGAPDPHFGTPLEAWPPPDTLAAAALAGHAARVRAWLDGGLPPDAPLPGGQTMLMLAAAHDHAPLARTLIAYGAQPDRPDDAGRTPLMHAARGAASARTARVLLQTGARPNRQDAEGRTPLMHAAAAGAEALVALLLPRADLALRDSAGRSALHHAAQASSPAVYRLLLAAGLAPDELDRFGKTPRQYAQERFGEAADEPRGGGPSSPRVPG
ncbi:MAG: ankyrin repeat domain-containing protein [Rubricoccaceae bacterium]